MAHSNICLFPGTFDPITNGHLDIINRSIYLFDELYIGIGVNSSKQTMFTAEQRKAHLEQIFSNEKKIKVVYYEGLTINFAKSIGAQTILRGIRTIADLEYERAIADMNRIIAPEIETFFLTCSAEFATVSSTLVRDLIKYKHSVAQFVPAVILNDIEKH
jgi:pantetheine-phosphate adenylyltransferase